MPYYGVRFRITRPSNEMLFWQTTAIRAVFSLMTSLNTTVIPHSFLWNYLKFLEKRFSESHFGSKVLMSAIEYKKSNFFIGFAISWYKIQCFTIQRCTIHAEIMFLFTWHKHSEERTQLTLHQRVKSFQWIIRMVCDSFPVEQKSDSFFPAMYIPFWIFSNQMAIAIWLVKRINLSKPHKLSLLSR